ncbi:MAG: hypothetical protein OXU23_03485 [Candidatus Poribacteria bacterium]|nr:hypothetical protein [Candidatus Poribacteria bacterium]
MINKFNIVSIISDKDSIYSEKKSIKRIPIDNINNITSVWNLQYDNFLQRKEIKFDAGYNPNSDECFYIKQFTLPDWLENVQVSNYLNVEATFDIESCKIRSMVGVCRNKSNDNVLLFQNFFPSNIIYPNSIIEKRQDRDTYEQLEGEYYLQFANKLTAIYNYSDEKLLFYSLHNVSMFLSLDEYYKEATNKDIKELLKDPMFKCDNPNIVLSKCNKSIRKMFSLLKYSDVLSKTSAKRIQEACLEINIHINIVDGKVLFPTNQDEITGILKVITKRILRSLITDELQESNSNRNYEDS